MAIGGVLTAMVTPFAADGTVDEAGAVRLMRHLIENGSDGLVLAGTTGEGATLSDAEKERLWELALQEVGGESYPVAGSGSNGTPHSAPLTRRAAETRMHTPPVVTPPHNNANRPRPAAHFTAAAQPPP